MTINGNSWNAPKVKTQRTVQDMVNELKAMQAHYDAKSQIMTPYEREIAQEALQDKRREYRASIRSAMDTQRQAAEKAHQEAAAKVERARLAEVSRWDPARLNSEMLLAERRIEQAVAFRLDGTSLTDRLGDIFAEARGDNHKIRAVYETLGAALAKAHGDDARHIAYVLNQVHADLREIRSTPELQAAREAELAARHELDQEAQLAKDVYSLTGLSAQEERDILRSEMTAEKTIEALNAVRAAEGNAPLTPAAAPTAPSTWS